MRTITRNAARCRKCGDIIESTRRHDFETCSCGSIFVDGGRDYIRCGADDLANLESLAEYAGEDGEGDEDDEARVAGPAFDAAPIVRCPSDALQEV